MGEKTKTSTQTSVSNPWGPAQPALAQSISDATSLYKSGIGNRPYTGSTVVPYSDQTMAGLGMGEHVAKQGYESLSGNMNRVERLIGDEGLTDLQRESLDQLAPSARGDLLVDNNPHTEAVVDRATQKMADHVGLLAGSMGRHGSGSHAGVLAREVGDVTAKLRQDDYNRERAMMRDAIGSRFNAGQQQRQNQLGDTDALIKAYQARAAPAQSLYDIGSFYEDLNTRRKNDEIRIHDAQQNAPWDALARLTAAASGVGQMGGTRTGSATLPGPSRAQGAIGGAIAGLPYGIGGAGIGGLLGLL